MAAGARRPEEVLPVRHLLVDCDLSTARTLLSPPANACGPVGAKKRNCWRPRPLAVLLLRRVFEALPAQGQSRRNHDGAPPLSDGQYDWTGLSRLMYRSAYWEIGDPAAGSRYRGGFVCAAAEFRLRSAERVHSARREHRDARSLRAQGDCAYRGPHHGVAAGAAAAGNAARMFRSSDARAKISVRARIWRNFPACDRQGDDAAALEGLRAARRRPKTGCATCCWSPAT